ncbi:hypothetical protein BDZ85DRAFT_264203 [Elsinoe ampelina]|uniref:Uncharacterized protein n=1 Tax=Elsinoe ampelina TaxID=302913 RepID=A0A6A6G7P0_9PEZI|nr:hypothetical protein BDZ85DRAFT_264203 [Elsinoe ampelina]
MGIVTAQPRQRNHALNRNMHFPPHGHLLAKVQHAATYHPLGNPRALSTPASGSCQDTSCDSESHLATGCNCPSGEKSLVCLFVSHTFAGCPVSYHTLCGGRVGRDHRLAVPGSGTGRARSALFHCSGRAKCGRGGLDTCEEDRRMQLGKVVESEGKEGGGVEEARCGHGQRGRGCAN